MKKYNNKQESGGYGGCVASGLKLTVVVFVIVAIWYVLSSCASTKNGCGSYSSWEQRHKTFNK